MRQVSSTGEITQLSNDARPQILSRIANIRCVDCAELQPVSLMLLTNPFRGTNSSDAHRCAGCGTSLYLTGKGRVLRSLCLNLPVFIASAGLGLFALRQVSTLFAVSEAGAEPGLVGFLLALILFVIPAVYAMLRFEHVAKFEGKSA